MKNKSLLLFALGAFFILGFFATCKKTTTTVATTSTTGVSCNLAVHAISDSTSVGPYGGIHLYTKADNADMGTTYTWTGPAGFTANTSYVDIFFPGSCQSGTYTVTAKSANGQCSSSSTINISVKASKPPRTITANTLSASGMVNTTFSTIKSDIADGHFYLYATDNQNVLKFTFYDSKAPIGNKIYQINYTASDPLADPYNVVVNCDMDAGGFTDQFEGISGYVYFDIVNGKYSATICDLNMASQNFSPKVSGNITSK